MLLFVGSIFAQKQNVDSLITVLENTKPTITEQLKLIRTICQQLEFVNNNKCKIYAEKGLELAKKINNKEFISKFYDKIGRTYEIKGVPDSAIFYFDKSLKLAVEINDNEQEACIYINLGVLNRKQNNYTKALEYYTKALSIYEKTNHKINCSIILTNISSIYRSMKNPERAVYFINKAKKIIETTDDLISKMNTYYEYGAIYGDLFNELEIQLEYIQKVYELACAAGHKGYESACLQAMSVTYLQIDNYDKALEYAHKSLLLGEELGHKPCIVGSCSALASAYSHKENWKQCDAYASKAWKIDSTDISFVNEILYKIVLSNIYLNNKKKAATFLEKLFDNIMKGHSDEKLQGMLIEIETRYETEKKELRIASLEKEKKFYIGLGVAGFTILLLAIILLFIRHRINIQKRKLSEQHREISEQKVKQLEQEKQLVATQAVLDGETAERSRLAKDLHDGLGGMLSVVKLNLKDMKQFAIIEGGDVEHFKKALEMLDQSISELRRVAHHIMPESLMRYGLKVSLEDFCRAIQGAHFQYLGENPRLDSRLEILIYRCAYELINNAVKHAQATAINVQLIIDEGITSLTVQDNGIGFDPKADNPGIGLENIKTRLAVYNGKMNIFSSPNNGTEISIEIEQNSD